MALDPSHEDNGSSAQLITQSESPCPCDSSGARLPRAAKLALVALVVPLVAFLVWLKTSWDAQSRVAAERAQAELQKNIAETRRLAEKEKAITASDRAFLETASKRLQEDPRDLATPREGPRAQ